MHSIRIHRRKENVQKQKKNEDDMCACTEVRTTTI